MFLKRSKITVLGFFVSQLLYSKYTCFTKSTANDVELRNTPFE